MTGCDLQGGVNGEEFSKLQETHSESGDLEEKKPPEKADSGEQKSLSEGAEGGEQKESPEKADSGEQDISSEYPKVAVLPEDTKVYLALYSEHCYCIYDGTRYGFMTEDGEQITPFLYERAAPFSEGLACVYLNGKYGFIGKEGEADIPFLYDQASSFTDGLAYVRIGEEYGFIDHEGKVVLQPDCDSVSTFQEGRAYFSIDGLYGYLDKDGSVVAEPVYEDAGSFHGGLGMVVKDGCYGVLGADGQEILRPEYDSIEREDPFLLAEKDGLWYCYDRGGRQILEEGWEGIYVRENLLLIERRDQFGLADRDGSVLMEPEYGSLYAIPGRKLVIAELDGAWGVLDYEGEEIVPFIYSWIAYDDIGDGLQVTRTERHEKAAGEWSDRRYSGFLGFEAEGGFTEIAPVYDNISFFVGDRAVVSVDKKYGVIRRDGRLEYSMEYDRIRLFEDGSMALWSGEMARLLDSDGKVICSGEYDMINAYGRGYEVRKDGKYGFLNGQGQQVISAVYDYYDYSTNYDICGADNVRRMSGYGQGVRDILIKTDEGEGTGLEEVFVQNYITPRAGEYLSFLLNGSVGTDNFAVSLSELSAGFRCFSKLCRAEEELMLYFYAEPYERWMFPMSHSGLYVLREGEMVQLAAGYECGGSMRGDSVCFWYDKEGTRRLPGVRGSWGGFGGYAYGGDVYAIEGGKAALSVSWYSVSQTTGNYAEEELLENAELFYKDGGGHYTRESVLEAESVTEYEVDGERTTRERFEEIRGRYRYMEPLDLYFFQ